MNKSEVKELLDKHLIISERKDGTQYIYGKIAFLNELEVLNKTKPLLPTVHRGYPDGSYLQ